MTTTLQAPQERYLVRDGPLVGERAREAIAAPWDAWNLGSWGFGIGALGGWGFRGFGIRVLGLWGVWGLDPTPSS